jgi:hypothetical protein
MARPGCVLRGALICFGLLFLPLGLWFAFRSFPRYVGQSLALIAVSLVFLRVGVSKEENSWMAAIDELGDDQNK